LNLGAKNNRFDTGYFKNIDVENGIMGGGVNVTQTTLLSNSAYVLADGVDHSFSLSDNMANYDYLTVTTLDEGSYTNTTIIDTANVNYTPWAYHSGNGYFKVGGSTIKLRAFAFTSASNDSISIKSIIGIKLNTLTTADIAEMAMPSKVNITIPDVIDDSTYTATANGLVAVQATSSNNSLASVYIRTLDSSSSIIRTSRNINYGSTASIFCSHMVAKGDTIAFGLINCTASSVKFFYSVGDAKALGLL